MEVNDEISCIACHAMVPCCGRLWATGILAQMKQKSWWEKNAPEQLYKHDYLMALFMHAFSWSFSISIPIILAGVLMPGSVNWTILLLMYIVNTIIHGFVDDMKANKKKINLVTDQCAYMLQIVLTWAATLL